MSRNRPKKRPKLTNEGVSGRFSYFFARALVNIRQNLFLNVVTVATITLALLIIALFLMVYTNLEGVADDWSRRVTICVYFENELAPRELASLAGRIQTLNGTDRVTYVSKDEAIKRFRSRLKGQEALLEGVSAEILPASMEITLKRGSRTIDAIEKYAAQLKIIPGIGEVQYGAEWVRRFSSFINFMRLVGAFLGGFLVLATTFIVSNTIKLTIFARKDELELLGLVGATRLFIKAPFLIEGIIQGASGAILSLVLLFSCYVAFLHNAGNFLSFNTALTGLNFLSPMQLTSIFFGGICLGFFGSLSSLKRFVNS
jgi:cell division transport system permease protein